uniref:Cathepsin B1 n=1 Tax=Mahanarva fimbriolata TaxID=672148 RepID=A0A7U3NJE7_9HEMI|nr:cathepsin B1 [Mahanarva fimbriolata]
MKQLVACAFLLLTTYVSCNNDYALSDDIVEKINKKKSTWKAKKNFDPETPRSYIQQLVGVQTDYEQNTVLEMQKPERGAGLIPIPKQFDAREKWPNCPSIGRIMDQSRCGSCWAVSVSEVLTDRICIHKNKQFNISAEDLLSCCEDCGRGCNGGYPQAAFQYFVDEGIASGGYYGSNKGCKPYSVAPCQRSPHNSCDLVSTPQCIKECRHGYPVPYEKDKYSGRVAYQVDSDNEKIQREILKNGPVQAAFFTYEDFFSYYDGIYQHVTGRLRGGHAVKIIGWGEENGVKYWLVANSWGKNWGGLHGLFKIIRGTNEVHFESQINAAIP